MRACSRRLSTGRRVLIVRSKVSKCLMIESIGTELCFRQDSRYNSASSDMHDIGLTEMKIYTFLGAYKFNLRLSKNLQIEYFRDQNMPPNDMD